jgi:hypothetical protein
VRAIVLASIGVLALSTVSADESASVVAPIAFTVPAGPQSFPGAQDVKQGCCSHHKGVCGCNAGAGRQLCRDSATSPTCGC